MIRHDTDHHKDAGGLMSYPKYDVLASSPGCIVGKHFLPAQSLEAMTDDARKVYPCSIASMMDYSPCS
jgi:hypothetical protein